jgi:hypothetical protein
MPATSLSQITSSYLDNRWAVQLPLYMFLDRLDEENSGKMLYKPSDIFVIRYSLVIVTSSVPKTPKLVSP